MSNRLEKENSPYLQQHKNNPVDWWPWCDEALEKAQTENKGIFISIGYSSCHWCDVMEESVFENLECADILNEHFVAIKIDREERPDIDKYYQKVYQLLNNRSGGWPASIFCTPQNKPFFAATYIPAESEEGSVQGMGFKELTTLISQKIAQKDEALFNNAEEVQSFIGQITHPKEASVLKEDFVKNFMVQIKSNYDTKNGGFSQAPKFPQASTLNALLVIDKLYNDKAANSMLRFTLDSMIKGGFYDLQEGGFFRYAQDDAWSVPASQKMLYDNALLCGVYASAYLQYQELQYLHIAKGCAEYWYNYACMDNLFCSANDEDLNSVVQTSYSAMMIDSLFMLGQIDAKYTSRAVVHLEALMNKLYVDGKLYHTSLMHKTPKVEAFLEDYAFLSSAMISAYKSTQDELYLIHAQRFVNTALEKFYKNGLWNFSSGTFVTKAEIYDNTYASEVSVMIDVMLSLGTLLKDEKYTHFAFKTLEYNSYELGRKPVFSPTMLVQMLRYLKG